MTRYYRRVSACIGGLILIAGSAAAEFVQAVEFPYHQYPRPLWERELVWLRNIGIRTVAFSIPTETRPGDPRADLPGLIKLLRRLELRAWIRGAAPRETAWLEPHLTSHGGPIAFADSPAVGAPPPPQPVSRLSATDPAALARSRRILAAGRGSLVWQDVEDTLAPLLRKGVVSFTGEERPGAAVLKRNAALLKCWAALLPSLRTERPLVAGIRAVQLHSLGHKGVSAVVVTNAGPKPFAGNLRAWDPEAKRELTLAGLNVPAGESLWLPVNVPLAGGGFCEDCSAFAPPDRIVYATAELHAVESENGILAFEFVAPAKGEVLVKLAREPSGPLLAGGRPAGFKWDESSSTVRLPVPAGQPPLYRVRIGLAIEPPESAGFFANTNPARLILGRPNIVSSSYSSAGLADRSRLVAPAGFRVRAERKSPLEIDYEVAAPADALHGEQAPLALEADGVRLGRVRMQLLRPASLRLPDAVTVHLGPAAELAVDPALVSIEPSGRNLRVIIRNNFPAIQNYVLEASGTGLKFAPERMEVSVGAATEREVAVRVFAEEPGLQTARLRLTGAAEVELALRILPVRRGEVVAQAIDLDGDGTPDWILENHRVRAAFNGLDGRWMEYVWKETGTNFLPEAGALPMTGPVTIKATQEGGVARLELNGPRQRRTIELAAERGLAIRQDSPLEAVKPDKRDGVVFGIEKRSAGEAVFTLARP